MSKLKKKFIIGLSFATLFSSFSLIGAISFMLFGFGIPGATTIFILTLVILFISFISTPLVYRYYKKNKKEIDFPFSFFVSLFFLIVFFAILGYMIALFVSSFLTHYGAFPILISSFGLFIAIVPFIVLLFYTISTVKNWNLNK